MEIVRSEASEMNTGFRRRVMYLLPLIAGVQPMVALERPTYAQEPVPRDEACAQPIYEAILWKPFIDGSLRAVQEGADRQLVLETLECIAIQDRTFYGIGGVALFAMVHLSKDDPELKDRLLRIIVSEKTFPTARGAACWFIRFVADATVQKELLSYMKKRWRTKEADEVFIALSELGSRGFLQFVEKCAADPQERPGMKARCEQLLPQLRAGQTLEGALRLFRTSVENDKIDWLWVVRRAARLGASKDQLRTAALAFLRSSREVGRDKFALGVLLQGLDKKYGFLTAADALEFPMSSSDGTWDYGGLREDNPVWATHYKELLRAFLRRSLVD